MPSTRGPKYRWADTEWGHETFVANMYGHKHLNTGSTTFPYLGTLTVTYLLKPCVCVYFFQLTPKPFNMPISHNLTEISGEKTTIKIAEVKTAIQTSLLLFSVLVFLFSVDKIDSQDFSQSPHKRSH